jgi:hypothetical protein
MDARSCRPGATARRFCDRSQPHGVGQGCSSGQQAACQVDADTNGRQLVTKATQMGRLNRCESCRGARRRSLTRSPRPLRETHRTARLRWRVDQTWTSHANPAPPAPGRAAAGAPKLPVGVRGGVAQDEEGPWKPGPVSTWAARQLPSLPVRRTRAGPAVAADPVHRRASLGRSGAGGIGLESVPGIMKASSTCRSRRSRTERGGQRPRGC